MRCVFPWRYSILHLSPQAGGGRAGESSAKSDVRQGAMAVALPRRLGIDGEIVGRLRAPQRQRVLGLVVAWFPRLRLGNVIDIAGIFGEAAPRVLHVMEIVGAEHVAAESPAPGVALVGHAGGAEADVVDRADVPAA